VATILEPTVVVVDFAEVHIATASFMREALLGFRDYCRNSRPNLFPIVAGLGVKVREELDGLLQLKGDILVACDLAPSGGIKDAAVIGNLDPKQKATLKAVLKSGRADAVTLAKRHRELPNPTAWNNRLAALASKGILRETQVGRSKVYEPVVEALAYGA
jgi:hypothetical protein